MTWTYGPMRGSFPWPWDEITEAQQTARIDEVLNPETAGQFYWVKERDSYRKSGSADHAPDWCPAADVESRRKVLDRHAHAPKENDGRH